MSLQAAAKSVLTCYAEATSQPPVSLGHHGGTSGARLWRAAGYNGALCLRAWPAGTPPAHLSFVHLTMHRAADLRFVPKVCQPRSGGTWIQQFGFLWDLTTWMPGTADFADQPSACRLENACAALAQLHLAWQGPFENARPCAAIQRRLERVHIWSQFIASGWLPPDHGYASAALHVQVIRAWQLLPPLVQVVPRQLHAVANCQDSPQPCHGDLWHDNVLFQGETVTGIVDYAALRLDHVAVDLARLLGSLVPDDDTMMAAGLAAYSAIRPLSPEDQELVHALDETGTVIGAANWLMWQFWEGVSLDNPDGAARRLGTLLDRIEGWPGNGPRSRLATQK